MVWLAIGTIVAKVASFLSIIVLGWYLTSEEFALYAIASSSAAVFMAVRNGGVQQILIQRGSASFFRLGGYFFKYSLMFNLVGMILLFVCMPFIAQTYGNQQLIKIIGIIAISLPLSSFSMLYRAKMSIDHQFAALAKFDSYSSVIRQGAAAIFAYYGFGVYSFVIPIVLAALFEIAAGYFYVGKISLNKTKLRRRIIAGIFKNAKWVVFASLATAFVLQGDYLVIGFFEDKNIVGQYFFGFQLTMAISVVITSGLQSVLMPIFSKLNADESRQKIAFNRAFGIYAYAVLIFSSLLIVTAELLVNQLWQGKWDQAIIVVQIIAFSMITRLLAPLGRTLLEARRKWKLTSLLLAVDAIGILIAALIGVYWGGLVEITLSIAIYRFIYGIVYLLIVARVVNIDYSDVVMPILKNLFSAGVALGYVFLIYDGLFDITHVVLKLAYLSCSYVITLIIMTWLIDREQVKEITAFLGKSPR